nr:RNA-directed DNA polymerase, eukaryota [Tanacetum cinerariifolium]
KKNLWDYILSLLGRWNGEVIVMGDFNDVRSSNERRGSCFNPYSAKHFNKFISSSSLVDIPMEGYSFTWLHHSASKMSKLDRFLISDGVFSLFPSIAAVCLDRHLSDHRPILLREVNVDFGPIPFRLYHSWFDYVGFDDMIKSAWSSFAHSDGNSRIRFKKKLQDLKSIIRWDENSKFFHGVVNKRRSQLAIRVIFVDGVWSTDPNLIKNAFFNHFATRFQEPPNFRFKINFVFPNKLHHNKTEELERHVSHDEIKRDVWDCGDNKSPGPDGFTFEFFKTY